MNWPVTPGGDPVSGCHLMAYSPSPALTKACCKMCLLIASLAFARATDAGQVTGVTGFLNVKA